MKLLIINEFGKMEIKEENILPRIGDKVDMFYRPYPTVREVLLYPSDSTISDLCCCHVDAIITVK